MEQCLREGSPLPDKIANAPDLIQGLELFYIAFMSLSNSRQFGMGVGPIPWNVIHDYCVANNLTEEQEEEMHHHIREMDSVFIEFKNRKK